VKLYPQFAAAIHAVLRAGRTPVVQKRHLDAAGLTPNDVSLMLGVYVLPHPRQPGWYLIKPGE
jgi:hypothetical protein